MKLQVNLKGSWRDVIHFADSEVDAQVVAILGRRLIAMSDIRCAMRLADDDNISIEYLGETDSAP